VAQDGTCAACGGVPPVADLVVAPGPDWSPAPARPTSSRRPSEPRTASWPRSEP